MGWCIWHVELNYGSIAPESPEKQGMLYGPPLLVTLMDKPMTIQKENVQVTFSSQPDVLPRFETADGQIKFLPFYKVREEVYTTYLSVGK